MHYTPFLLQPLLFTTTLASQTYWFGDFSNYYEDGIATHPNLDKDGGCCGYTSGDVDCSVGCNIGVDCGPKDPDAIGDINRCGIAWTDDCGRSVVIGDGSGTDCNWDAGDGNEVARIKNTDDGSDAGYCVSYSKTQNCYTWGSQIYGIALECYTDACGPVETWGPINTAFANGDYYLSTFSTSTTSSDASSET